MPRLILEARRIAATVIHGLHGRRRAGPGENFWQYRRFLSGEPARRVDWRRSARDGILYVREQEWEAAHTVWIWPDRSPSMHFTSPLATESKLSRTLVIAFALAEVLVHAGERVGMPGLMRPTGSRNVLDKMANAVVHDVTERSSLPPAFVPSSLSEIVLVSDFWSPMTEIRATLSQLSATGAHGHTVQVVDPAEETFPYSGRVEFIEPEGGGLDHRRPRRGLEGRLRRARRAPSRRAPRRDRQARLELCHPPHRPAGDRAAAGAACAHGRAAARRRGRRPRSGPEVGMMPSWLPLGFAQPLVLLGLLSLPVLWWLLRLIPPQPRDRLPAHAACCSTSSRRRRRRGARRGGSRFFASRSRRW